MNTGTPAAVAVASDTVDARRLFEENIDAIHKRDRARYLATYLHTSGLARNGPAGLELGYDNWSALRDSTWPDTLIARNLRVTPIIPGVVYGTYYDLERRIRARIRKDAGGMANCGYNGVRITRRRGRAVQIATLFKSSQ